MSEEQRLGPQGSLEVQRRTKRHLVRNIKMRFSRAGKIASNAKKNVACFAHIENRAGVVSLVGEVPASVADV
jgi:hypothetical protein